MELTIPQQAKKLIEESTNILLVAHAKMDGDTLSATIAMHLLLQKLSKNTTVVCADPVPESFSFLPETSKLQNDFDSNSDFIITLNSSRTKAKAVRWETIGDQLKIYVTPTGEKFQREDLTLSEEANFDLIISLDAADLKQLGSIFEDNTELFSRLPLVVFDHHASNPGFGTVNLIDTKAASTTEVLFHFLPVLFGDDWQKKMDPDIATLLLTGIITDTGSFQNPNTTPRSLEVAADLVELGARQQEIIRNIFKTKNIPTLKLWGRVLSKIKTDPVHRVLWSTVTSEDLIDTGATRDDTEGIIDELLATAPGMEMVLLIKEREDGVISTSTRTTTPLCDAAKFCYEFGGGGHTQAAGFKIRGNRPFESVVGDIIEAVQKFQENRLHIPREEVSEKKEGSPSEEKKTEEVKEKKVIDVLEAAKKGEEANQEEKENAPKEGKEYFTSFAEPQKEKSEEKKETEVSDFPLNSRAKAEKMNALPIEPYKNQEIVSPPQEKASQEPVIPDWMNEGANNTENEALKNDPKDYF